MARIGIDLSPLAGRPAGVGKYCRGLLEGLSAAEHDLEIMGYLATHRRLAPALEIPPSRRIPLPARAVYALWESLGRPRADAFLGGTDLIHATNYVLPPVRSARRVLSIHDMAMITHPEWCSPRIARSFARHLRWAAPRADAILAPSNTTKEAVSTHLGVPAARVYLTAYGASPPRRVVPREEAREFVARFGVNGPFFLFVGTLEPRKNLSGLLAAFSRLAGDLPHQLVLAGALGWGTETFGDSLKRLTDKGRAVHLGYVDEPLLEALYAAADALVFPSWDEGFGLPLLEGMARGRPVIASHAGSLPEVADDAALLVDPADIAGLAAAMQTLGEDEGRRSALAARGRERARQFTWKRTAEATLAVYRTLL